MRMMAASTMALAMLAGCSDKAAPGKEGGKEAGVRPSAGKAMTTADADLRRYIESEKGRHDRDASIAKTQKGTMAAFGTSMKNAGISAFEGAWTSQQAAVEGYRLHASIGRDGVIFMELVDAAGASRQYAQGSITISGMSAQGTLRNAKGGLAGLSKWRMRRNPNGVTLSGDEISVILTQKDRYRP